VQDVYGGRDYLPRIIGLLSKSEEDMPMVLHSEADGQVLAIGNVQFMNAKEAWLQVYRTTQNFDAVRGMRKLDRACTYARSLTGIRMDVRARARVCTFVRCAVECAGIHRKPHAYARMHASKHTHTHTHTHARTNAHTHTHTHTHTYTHTQRTGR
jgi:hypothetical protein